MNLVKHRRFGVTVLSSILASAVLGFVGCGSSAPKTTNQDEITRFLEENPGQKNPAPEVTDSQTDEFKGIVITPERV